jgi:hypothetical protein
MIASVSSVSGILVLCTLRFIVCFVVLHSIAHNRGRGQPSLTHFRQMRVGVITLCNVKFAKTTLSHTRFLQINKCNQYLVSPELLSLLTMSEVGVITLCKVKSVKTSRPLTFVKVTLRLTVSQSVSLGVEPHLGLMTRYLLLFDSYCVVLSLYNILSDVRMALPFVYAAGPRQRSLSRVRVPWY